ncbi:MAG: extracellular solute-binding protein [Ardenticatenaceae bacterium]
MTKRVLMVSIVLFFMSFLTACSASDQGELDGQLLIWHSWEGAEREALQKFVENFRVLHPELTIVEDFFPFDEIEEAYLSQVEAGLGPDLLIAPADWAARLAEAGAIQDIAAYEVDQEVYLSAAMDTLRNQDQVYGLPLSLSTSILYYNKQILQAAGGAEESASAGGVAELIEARRESITDTQTSELLNELLREVEQNQAESEALAPPTDVDQILEQASLGQIVTMRNDFYGAFWGVQVFGGHLFDKEGRVVLNQGGLANWLSWLKKAQSNPNIILNRNPGELQRLFTSGQASYYVGSTDELVGLQSALGKEALAVIRLPGRRNKAAGPLVQVEAMMFNRVSTRRNTELALRLAQFLTNREHQRQLVLSVGKLPTNNQVNIDARIEPIVAEFIAQSKSAVSVKLEDLNKFNELLVRGDELYGQVLEEEEIGVGDAATLLTTEINEQYGLETLVANQLEDCEVKGDVVLWNTWTGASRDALMALQKRFTDACPETSITIVDVDSVELYNRYLEAFETEEAPDLFTGDNKLIRRLASEERLLNLNDLLDPDFFQQFIPQVEQAVLFEGEVYAIPVSLNTNVLYVNKELVPDPPVLLDDLLTVASPETEVAIPIGFFESYWGLSAFGESSTAELLDQEGRLIVEQSGLAEWLAWLAEAGSQPGVIFSRDQAELQSLFLSQDQDQRAVLLVSDATQLSTIQGSFGEEKLQVLPLPSGSPLLEVDGLLFHPFMAQKKRAVALKFAQFVSNIESQSFLMEQANRVPTNINVSTSNYPAISAFVEQADTATVIPNLPQVEAVFEWGDSVYEEVLQNDLDPALAVRNFTNIVDVSNGFEIVSAEGEEACTEEGEVTLWHSWNEIEAAAWQEVISNFAERCPNINVTPTFVEAADFNKQLAATLESDKKASTLPDLFIASHSEVEAYQTEQLIQEIGQAVDETRRTSYLSQAIEALSVGDKLYGLPQALHLPALYYRSDLVESPPSTFDALLEQAAEGNKVAMSASFYELFWGAAAFGCEACQARQLFDEQGELALSQADFAVWLRWLKSAQTTNQIIFDADQYKLEKEFLEGEVTYLVADSSFLNQAQAELGIAGVSVAPLPFGEEAQAPTPLLTVESFFLHSQASEEQAQLALNFILFACSQPSQTLLMEQANFVPTTDLAITTADDPDIAPFIAEIDASLLLPQQSRREEIEKSGLFNIYDELAE